MAKKWQVVLVKTPVVNEYENNYFPRSFHYKADAEMLAEEVKRKGGDTRVEKIKRPLAEFKQ